MSTPETSTNTDENGASVGAVDRGSAGNLSEMPGDAPPEAAAGGLHDAVETLPPGEAWEVFRQDL